jgi:hypothetical protein
VLKVRPISDHGNVNEIIGKFVGAEQLREAVVNCKLCFTRNEHKAKG